jgi:hypothetical protein
MIGASHVANDENQFLACYEVVHASTKLADGQNITKAIHSVRRRLRF